MRTERFDDRLDPKTYQADDEVVGIYETDPNEDEALWFSGRLFRRLTTIGIAYELHTLPLLDGSFLTYASTKRSASLLWTRSHSSQSASTTTCSLNWHSPSDFVTTRVRQAAWLGDITFGFD